VRARCRTFLPLAMLLAAPPTARGQAPPGQRPESAAVGSVRGQVFDSLAHAWLDGANVRVQGTSLSATTDRRGRFLIDSVPAGRRILVLDHPGLDSAGIGDVPAVVNVVAGSATDAGIGVPSLHTLTTAVCGGSAFPPGRDSGIVYGAVRDAESGDRLVGALVKVSWLRIERTRAALHVTRPVRGVRADSLGNYYACGLPVSAPLNVRAGAGAYASGELDLEVGRRRLLRHDLSFSRQEGAELPPPSEPRSGAATIVGQVSDETGRPLESVQANVPEAAGDALTDRSGRFVLTGLPAGSQMLFVRRVGYHYAETPVELRSRDTTRVALTLEMFSLLDTLRVTASPWARAEIGDLQRRLLRASVGQVRRAEELAGIGAIESAFYTFPSLTVTHVTGGFRLEMRRGARACSPAIWIDGFQQDQDILDLYRPSDLVALEVYPPSQVPLRYASAFSSCGVVLAWTRYLQ
jgi:hypothetical protein